MNSQHPNPCILRPMFYLWKMLIGHEEREHLQKLIYSLESKMKINMILKRDWFEKNARKYTTFLHFQFDYISRMIHEINKPIQRLVPSISLLNWNTELRSSLGLTEIYSLDISGYIFAVIFEKKQEWIIWKSESVIKLEKLPESSNLKGNWFNSSKGFRIF